MLRPAFELTIEMGEVPSRNRLMCEFRIGAPKADELRSRLLAAGRPATAKPVAVPFDYAKPIGPDPLPAPVVPEPVPLIAPDPTPAPEITPVEPVAEVTPVGHPDTPAPPAPRKGLAVWPVWLLMLPAFVAVSAGWVELGKLTGFGPVDLLPGFTRDGGPLVTLDTAITLPIGRETYAGYALYVWLSGRTTAKARKFAMGSA